MKNFSEQDITSKYVLPALPKAGWDSNTQIREQYTFTAGRIIVRGKTVKRGEKKRVDVLLFYRNHYPIAVIEVKDNPHAVGDGMQQGLNYAEALDTPFVYSTNGKAFLAKAGLFKNIQSGYSLFSSECKSNNNRFKEFKNSCA